jgi:dUTP pyrophosphatase
VAQELEVRVLRPGGRVPARAHPGDAGLDLAAAEGAELAPGARARASRAATG